MRAGQTGAWVDATVDLPLAASAQIQTGREAIAEITAFDGTVFRMRPESLMALPSTPPASSMPSHAVAYEIASGEVDLQTGKGVHVWAPGTKTRVSAEGTAAIRAVKSGGAEIRMLEGAGEVVTKTGETVDLSRGQGIRVDPAGVRGPKFTLPPAPLNRAPVHQAELSYRDPARATSLLVWSGVPGAAAYHFMIDYTPHFSAPLMDRAGLKDTSVELRGLPPGRYYWRVAALDPDGVEGPFSNFTLFTVAPAGSQTAGPPPPLEIRSLETRADILQIRGRTEPGATLTVNGQRVDVAKDGSFNEFLTLPEGARDVVIRAVGVRGGVIEQKRRLLVTE